MGERQQAVRGIANVLAGFVATEGLEDCDWMAEAILDSGEVVTKAERPTHICLDCGAVSYGGGGSYHDHGDGEAGDTASIAAVLAQLEKAGDALDERDELLAELAERTRERDEAREALAAAEAWLRGEDAIEIVRYHIDKTCTGGTDEDEVAATHAVNELAGCLARESVPTPEGEG